MPHTKKIIYFPAGQRLKPEEAAKLREATIAAQDLAVRVAPLANTDSPDRSKPPITSLARCPPMPSKPVAFQHSKMNSAYFCGAVARLGEGR